LSGAGCTSLDASPDGSRLAVGTNVTRGDDPRLVLVELSTGTVRGLGPAGRYRQASGWSPDGTRVVTLTASGAVGPRLVSAPSGVAGPTLGSASTSVRVSR
jgi:Tol biopolymer transport system component